MTATTLLVLPTRYGRVVVTAVSAEVRLLSGVERIPWAVIIVGARIRIGVTFLNDVLGFGCVGKPMGRMRSWRVGQFLRRVPRRGDLGRRMSDVDGVFIAMRYGSGHSFFGS